MKYVDPHIHMFSRTTDDYQNMAAAGIVAVVEPAFWLGQPRTQIGSFIDYFDTLIGWEHFRASQFGIQHYCTMGLNPKESNDIELAEAVMKMLPRYCQKDNVVAVGEIGYDDMTPAEDRFFAEHLELAKDQELPVLVHTPHRDKVNGTKRTIDVIRESGIAEEMVIIDHLNEQTLPLVLETDCWRGHSIYPNTKMSEPRMVALLKEYGLEKMIINSAADWGISDPLKVPKTAQAMLEAGFTEKEVELVTFENPINFFAQSGRISLDSVKKTTIDQTKTYKDNRVTRGQTPIVEQGDDS
ncbi:hydrolase TatD [Saccharobesus litoralis]|uniref:Hydrolase TatD n=1 Tax=Saccharobesus litoralis TaxID=2172099 RepID=A0A2S0VT69_9ALTE|nr:TatD family hydrolase [Saccharobesus litoralis]AWB67418.1 hydrolase TatD [Saccharobesus litoralis]